MDVRRWTVDDGGRWASLRLFASLRRYIYQKLSIMRGEKNEMCVVHNPATRTDAAASSHNIHNIRVHNIHNILY